MLSWKFLYKDSHPILCRDVLTFTNLKTYVPVPMSFIITSVLRFRTKRNKGGFMTLVEASFINYAFLPQKPPNRQVYGVRRKTGHYRQT